MSSKKDLLQIIKSEKLCITENPKGIDRLWPKSYIKLFYNDFCKKLYSQNNSPSILEIGQDNKLNIQLWKYYFDNAKVKSVNENFLNSLEKQHKGEYDLIIISSNEILKNSLNLSSLIKLINKEGLIVIENIGLNLKVILKIFLIFFYRYQLNIYDYRLKIFIRHNCLLTIKLNKSKINFNSKFKSIFSLFKFIIFEIFISIFFFILNKYKKI